MSYFLSMIGRSPRINSLPAAHKAFQLLDELRRFFGCNKRRSLHRIEQKPHLRRFKGTRGKKIAGFGRTGVQNIKAEAFEQLDITIDRFALRSHAAFFQFPAKLLRGKRVLLIRLFLKNLKKIQRFQLCICTACQMGSLQFLTFDRGRARSTRLSCCQRPSQEPESPAPSSS